MRAGAACTRCTDEGRAYAEAHADELRASWDAVAGLTDDAAIELGVLFRQVALAAMEVRRAGTPSQLAAARQVLAEARRALYRILADDAPAGEPDGDATTRTAPTTSRPSMTATTEARTSTLGRR